MEINQGIYSTSFSGYFLQSTTRNTKILTKGNPSTVHIWRISCTDVRENFKTVKERPHLWVRTLNRHILLTSQFTIF